jgi:hypothetical protein
VTLFYELALVAPHTGLCDELLARLYVAIGNVIAEFYVETVFPQ